MKTAIEKRYYFIPVLYICIIGIFLYFHFSDSRTFTKEFGHIVVTGTVPGRVGGQNDAITSARVSCDNFEFSFGEKERLTLRTTNGTVESVGLKTYSLLSDGIELRFAHNVVLRFVSGGGANERVTIYPRIDNARKEIAAVEIPFTLPGKAEIETAGELPIISVTDDTDTAFLMVNHNSVIDLERMELQLASADNGLKPVSIEYSSKPDINIYTYWFTKGTNISDNKTAYEQVLNDYLDKAYRGWQDRYAQGPGEWQIDGEETVFSEELVACYLSSALARDEYAAALNQIQTAIDRHEDQLTLFTVPYFGNMIQRTAGLGERDVERIEEIERLIRNENPQLFTQSHLMQFIVDHGPFSLVNEVYRLAEVINPENLTVEELVGVLKTYNELPFDIPDTEPVLAALADTAEGKLLASIIQTEEGYFLQNKEGGIEIDTSLKAGKQLLVKGNNGNGTTQDNGTISALGRELVISALGTADGNGNLPAEATVHNGSLVITESAEGPEELIPAEEIYPFSLENSYYPREISLYEHIGPGSWIWTIADFTAIDAGQNEIVFDIDFPVGRTHHLIIQGIKPFAGIRLHGISWRSDPAFERYSSGWVYNTQNQTLYVKLTHREEQEQLVITY